MWKCRIPSESPLNLHSMYNLLWLKILQIPQVKLILMLYCNLCKNEVGLHGFYTNSMVNYINSEIYWIIVFFVWIVLSAIARINQAVDTGNAEMIFNAMCDDDAHLNNLDHSCQEKYQKQLAAAKKEKRRVSVARIFELWKWF